jgi:hypothetical protein
MVRWSSWHKQQVPNVAANEDENEEQQVQNEAEKEAKNDML